MIEEKPSKVPDKAEEGTEVDDTEDEDDTEVEDEDDDVWWEEDQGQWLSSSLDSLSKHLMASYRYNRYMDVSFTNEDGKYWMDDI